jgi:protein involved in polysaccharide export with SLBB domain
MNKIPPIIKSVICLVCMGLLGCAPMDQSYDPRFNMANKPSGRQQTHIAAGPVDRTPGFSQSAPALRDIPSAPQNTSKASPEFASQDERPKLSPGDVLELKVYQEDELNAKVRVESDGMITFPLLKPLKASGRTLEEVRLMVRDVLARDYLVDPHVSLTVVEFAKRRFSVMGEVKVPGFYSMPEDRNLNLLQALSMAGGYTAFSKGTRVSIKRTIDGKESVMRVDANAMAKNKNVKVILIEPDDAIEVGPTIF